MYADNTTLASSLENPYVFEHKMNFDMNLIQSWLTANKLTLNVIKTKYKISVSVQIYRDCNLQRKCGQSYRSWSERLDFILSTAAITATAHAEKMTKSEGLIAKAILNRSATALVNVELSSMFPIRIIKGVSLAILDMILK